MMFPSLCLLLGILILAIPFGVRNDARNLVYAVTDERIFAIHGGRKSVTMSMDATEIRDYVAKEWPDGRGDLVFTEFLDRSSDGENLRHIEFIAISEVRSVANLIRVTFPRVPMTMRSRRGATIPNS
jgi:hypothetical protein